MTDCLRFITKDEIPRDCAEPVDPKALEQARAIVDDIRNGGKAKVSEWAVKLGDIPEGADINVTKEELKAAYDSLDDEVRAVLDRTAERIKAFATSQRNAVQDMTTSIPGGQAGHIVAPVQTAGCYAPGGRYPLPSSVLMTAVTARAAGVKEVWVASPRPSPVTLAAGHVAGADGFLRIGGAQAIASLAEGIGCTPADVIVGPGNKWVTAAKSLVQGKCSIDMLAGPSEVLVICDETCNAKTVAADLIAQAEHDVESRPILITTSKAAADAVNEELKKQLAVLPTAETAREAVTKGFAVVVDTIEEAVAISDSIGPEHLEVQTKDSKGTADLCGNYGGLFVGVNAAEVLGDYGAGPNHVLPTGGTSRYTGGLSVFNFLRIRTWMQINDRPASQTLVTDAVKLARLEGLEGHARAAEQRLD
eukprot:TRINITY_DN15423_c0_g1_i1.p1 TRINITY_DN15423_c0_g1~~TRINITY_DN15423_c0_g1_i1.p1  ORF type:complete len:420 (+),score=147.45 TRINITY_DN15423_c0_g1_i1:52-1311(+)